MLNLSLALAPVREDSSGTALVAWLMIGGLAIANKAKRAGGNMVETWWKYGGNMVESLRLRNLEIAKGMM